MNIKKFEEVLCNELHARSKELVLQLTANDTYLRNNAWVDLNKFMNLLRKRIPKIYNFLIHQERIDDRRFDIETSNFIFSYYIAANKSSKLTVAVLKKKTFSFDIEFLTLKTPKLYGYVYFIKSEYGIKVGSTTNLNTRMNTFGVKLPFKVDLHSFIQCHDYQRLEQTLHQLLSGKRINGEWFKLEDGDYLEIDKFIANMGLKRETNEDIKHA